MSAVHPRPPLRNPIHLGGGGQCRTLRPRSPPTMPHFIVGLLPLPLAEPYDKIGCGVGERGRWGSSSPPPPPPTWIGLQSGGRGWTADTNPQKGASGGGGEADTKLNRNDGSHTFGHYAPRPRGPAPGAGGAVQRDAGPPVPPGLWEVQLQEVHLRALPQVRREAGPLTAGREW